jgi:hypothetical protein
VTFPHVISIFDCRFEQPESAKAAIDSMNGFDLGGRQLKVIQIALTFHGYLSVGTFAMFQDEQLIMCFQMFWQRAFRGSVTFILLACDKVAFDWLSGPNQS